MINIILLCAVVLQRIYSCEKKMSQRLKTRLQGVESYEVIPITLSMYPDADEEALRDIFHLVKSDIGDFIERVVDVYGTVTQ